MTRSSAAARTRSSAATARTRSCRLHAEHVPDHQVTCNLGSLASGATATKVLGVSWGVAGDRTVKATVSSTTADPTAANNSETEHASVS